MKNRFSPELKETISFGLEEARRLQSDWIGTGHLLLGMIKQDHNTAISMLKNFQIALPELKKEIEGGIESERKESGNNAEASDNKAGKARVFSFFLSFRKAHKAPGGLPLNKEAERAIRESVVLARDAKSPTVDTEHLMLSMLNNPEDPGTKILNRLGLDNNKVAGIRK
jgi:ATP-dependent Clp protease ATP-binding subunit ClpC